jgi:valyl-tRNA synthetase
MTKAYPEMDKAKIDEKAEITLSYIQECIVKIRTFRSERNLSPNEQISAIYKSNSPEVDNAFSSNLQSIKTLAKLSDFRKLKNDEVAPISAPLIANDFEILVPIADVQSEIDRLQKELKKHLSDFEHASNKLSNESFCQRASPDAVEKERIRKENAAKIMETINKMIAFYSK